MPQSSFLPVVLLSVASLLLSPPLPPCRMSDHVSATLLSVRERHEALRHKQRPDKKFKKHQTCHELRLAKASVFFLQLSLFLYLSTTASHTPQPAVIISLTSSERLPITSNTVKLQVQIFQTARIQNSKARREMKGKLMDSCISRNQLHQMPVFFSQQ